MRHEENFGWWVEKMRNAEPEELMTWLSKAEIEFLLTLRDRWGRGREFAAAVALFFWRWVNG